MMRIFALATMLTGTATAVVALALLVAGWWLQAPYALVSAGGLLILGALVGIATDFHHRLVSRHAAGSAR